MGYRTLGLLGFGLATALGCEARPTLVPVTGKVTIDGSPVHGAVVQFLNRDPEGRPAIGMTNAEGRFSLRTYLRPDEEPEGAQPGDYDVVITKTVNVRRMPDPQLGWQSLPDEAVHLLPQKYSKPGSGLEARVNEAEPNEFLFDLDVELPKSESPPAGKSSRSPGR